MRIPCTRLLVLAALAITLATSGCVMGLSSPPTVRLPGREKPVSVKDIPPPTPFGLRVRGGVIYPGLTRAEVHQRLAGLPATQFDPGHEQFGPFQKEIRTLYIFAWEGPHTFGVYPVPSSFSILVNYDAQGVVEECWSEVLSHPWAEPTQPVGAMNGR